MYTPNICHPYARNIFRPGMRNQFTARATADAIYHLRQALRGTRNPRAKSKLMLAIRECNRAARNAGQ